MGEVRSIYHVKRQFRLVDLKLNSSLLSPGLFFYFETGELANSQFFKILTKGNGTSSLSNFEKKLHKKLIKERFSSKC